MILLPQVDLQWVIGQMGYIVTAAVLIAAASLALIYLWMDLDS